MRMIIVGGLLMAALLGAVLGSVRAQDDVSFLPRESAATAQDKGVSRVPGSG